MHDRPDPVLGCGLLVIAAAFAAAAVLVAFLAWSLTNTGPFR